jgi:hypothetical protein
MYIRSPEGLYPAFPIAWSNDHIDCSVENSYVGFQFDFLDDSGGILGTRLFGGGQNTFCSEGIQGFTSGDDVAGQYWEPAPVGTTHFSTYFCNDVEYISNCLSLSVSGNLFPGEIGTDLFAPSENISSVEMANTAIADIGNTTVAIAYPMINASLLYVIPVIAVTFGIAWIVKKMK